MKMITYHSKEENNLEDRLNTSAKRCVDCLVEKKVYDSCSKRECLENLLFSIDLPNGELEDYCYMHTEFSAARVERYENQPYFTEKDDNYAILKAVLGVDVYVVLKRKCDRAIFRLPALPMCANEVQKDNTVRIPVELTVYAPKTYLRQGRFYPFAESLVETGCVSVADCNTLRMSLGFFFIVKVVSDVQLKVPNFGFCEVPPECCEEPCDINFCQTFLDEAVTPFPQFFPSELG